MVGFGLGLAVGTFVGLIEGAGVGVSTGLLEGFEVDGVGL